MSEHYTNHLAGQSSPYLQQHVHNPVDWHPWGPEAFDRAKAEDKPIFLSIGYATCHWCHVMEKESFANVQIAALMNEAFVNVKVDREELPQVDSLYMEVAQAMMGGGGGWPLNLVLTPDLRPIFAGTYLPPEEGRGMLSMRQLITRIQELWGSEHREALLEQADVIMEALQPEEGPPAIDEGESAGKAQVQSLAEIYYKMADPVGGGVQGEPKFPMAFHLSFMLRYAKLHGDSRALFYASKTLDMMQRGGIHDHLGGGFSRYSVDADWQVPHFEKMLYDNAVAAKAYIEGWQATDNALFRAVAEEIFRYLLRDMTHPDGAFYSAEDADSEGQEGRFYSWTKEEVFQVLGEKEAALFCEFYGFDDAGNFEHGRNLLFQEKSIEEFAKEKGLDPLTFADRLAQERHQLWQVREKREHPFCDDKVITGWNGLAIRALADGAIAFGSDHYLTAATKAADFIKRNLWVGEHLVRRWRAGEIGMAACLEDYAYLISGLLSLFNAHGGSHHLAWAIKLCNVLSGEFKKEGGAFYRTDGSDPNLLVRQIELYDGAEPSGNAVHCENLLRLYQITGAERFLVEAEDIFKHSRDFMQHFPMAGTYHCMALQRYLDHKASTLVIALDEQESLRKEITKAFGERYLPHAELIWRKADDTVVTKLVPMCRDQVPVNGRTTLYLCFDGRCKAPISDPQAILDTLKSL